MALATLGGIPVALIALIYGEGLPGPCVWPMLGGAVLAWGGILKFLSSTPPRAGIGGSLLLLATAAEIHAADQASPLIEEVLRHWPTNVPFIPIRSRPAREFLTLDMAQQASLALAGLLAVALLALTVHAIVRRRLSPGRTSSGGVTGDVRR